MFYGRFFGPASPGLVSYATGTSIAADSPPVIADRCFTSLLDQSEARCILPPGVGHSHKWSLTVAGQSSAVLNSQTSSFAPPVITSVAIGGVVLQPLAGSSIAPTAGGTVVVMTGSGFGLSIDSVSVSWGGAIFSDVRIAAADSSISFTSPAGQGADVDVVVIVGGQRSNVVSVGYAIPVVTTVSLIRGNSTEASSLDCSVIDADGRPLQQGSVGTIATTVVSLLGVNFGFCSSTSVLSGGIDCVIASCSQSAIRCITSVCTGEPTRA